MKEIRNHKEQLVCMVDPETGLIEQRYKHQTTRTHLPIGGEITIERNNVVTTIKRLTQFKFESSSKDT